MTTSTAGTWEPRPIRAGSPAAILTVIPVLLGFTPESSFVVIGTDPSGQVKVTMRYDLPDPADSDLATDIATHALAVLDSQHLPTATAAGYGPDSLVRPLAGALTQEAARYSIHVSDIFRLDQGRYWSYTCHHERCCPPAGTPFDPAGSPAAAALAAAGQSVLPAREALAATLAPLGGIAAESMSEATARAERHASQVHARLRRTSGGRHAARILAEEGIAIAAQLLGIYQAGGRYKTDYQLARLSVALRDLRVRDDAWARMDPGYCQQHLRLWTDVTRRAQPGYIAAPASLLAFCAWQAGNGALANVALDRAQADDPRYSMADLLRGVVTAGAPPSMARLPMSPEDVAASYASQDIRTRDDAGGQPAGPADAGRAPAPAAAGTTR